MMRRDDGRPLRVGVVTTSYPRYPGDPAGNFVAAHVDWLLSRGHRVDVVCAGDAELTHRAWQDGVSIIPVRAGRGLFYAGGAPDALERSASKMLLAAGRFSVAFAGVVVRRARNWDMAFAHWVVPSGLSLCLFRHRVLVTRCLAPITQPLAPITQPLAPRGTEAIPTLTIAHSGDIHLIRQLGATTHIAGLLKKRHLPIVFVSSALREQFIREIRSAPIRHWHRRHSAVIPMGIDVARFRTLRHSGRFHSDPLRILFVGRLVPIKGVHVLLAAVDHLRHLSTRPIELIIAGHGPERSALERRAAALTATRVHFTGEVCTRERDKLLAQADILVLPSVPRDNGRTEGSPVTALEAMAAGVPVIASRTGGLAEIPDGAIGLVPANDPRTLALAIANCERHVEQRERRISTAIQYAETLDWEHIGERLLARVR